MTERSETYEKTANYQAKDRAISADQRGKARTLHHPRKAVRAILRHRHTEQTSLAHCPNSSNTTVSIRDNCVLWLLFFYNMN